jgi:hypothetical protein
MYLTQDYKDIVEIFNINEVRYLLVGAYAMAVFGYARSTYDIDLWISRDDENITKVLQAIEEFGVPFEISKEDIKKDNSVIQIGIIPNRIDILTGIDGVEFEEAWSNKKSEAFGELVINVLSLKDIIKNKLSSSRSKDQIDAIELQKIKEKK